MRRGVEALRELRVRRTIPSDVPRSTERLAPGFTRTTKFNLDLDPPVSHPVVCWLSPHLTTKVPSTILFSLLLQDAMSGKISLFLSSINVSLIYMPAVSRDKPMPPPLILRDAP